MAIFSPFFTRSSFLPVSVSVPEFLPFIKTLGISDEAQPHHLVLNNYICTDPISKYGHILRHVC